MSDAQDKRAQRGRKTQSKPNPLDRAALELEREKAGYKFRLLSGIVAGFKGAAWIAAAWVPLQPIRIMVRDLAGKQTDFSAVINITVAISIALGLGWAITAARSHNRKKTVLHLRERLAAYEQRLLLQGIDPNEMLDLTGPKQDVTG